MNKLLRLSNELQAEQEHLNEFINHLNDEALETPYTYTEFVQFLHDNEFEPYLIQSLAKWYEKYHSKKFREYTNSLGIELADFTNLGEWLYFYAHIRKAEVFGEMLQVYSKSNVMSIN